MAAYAAVLSLIHTIEQIQNHPRPPISLHTSQVQSLGETLTFLQQFLEDYPVNDGEGEDLEHRIADAAYRAEDIIESLIVDRIEAANAESTNDGNMIAVDLFQVLEKVMGDLDLIKGDVAGIMEHRGNVPERNYSIPSARPRSPPAPSDQGRRSGGGGAMVGHDDVMLEAMEKLTAQQPRLEIVSIVGMGGIGKTTLARNVYVHPTIEQHFYLRAWATISQDYDSKEILVEALSCLKNLGSRESLSQMEEHELGEKLHKALFGQKYLIVLDDIWSIQAWEKAKFFFPDNSNGSRIMITTRLSSLAFELSGGCGLEMGFLDEESSWNLFKKSVFGEQDFPMELEGIGKQISRNCKGLPLSIVVIGGLLSKANKTREHWQYIAENLNSVVNLNDNERCMRILRMSYNHLPVHLKPCFLYMGIFPEDRLVKASSLVKLWVAEGFLKPISGKTMEAAAGEYLKDLVQRNLILVGELGYYRNIKFCKIHDLLRDLCIKEAEKDKFFCVAATDNSPNEGQSWHAQRRIGIQRRESSSKNILEAVLNNMQSATLARSLICNVDKVPLAQHTSRLLRVFHRIEVLIPKHKYSLEDIFRPINSRHLVASSCPLKCLWFPSSFYHLWNLQTLTVELDYSDCDPTPPLIDIWRMPRLRHVKVSRFRLPNPPTSLDNSEILLDLQTLKEVSISKWAEEAVRRIPNLKKLSLVLLYSDSSSCDDYQLDNLCLLLDLESLCYRFLCTDDPTPFWGHNLATSLVFPRSLRKLSLIGTYLLWEDLASKLGHLPHLQVLKLRYACKGPEWETVEDHFQSLKVLEIKFWHELEYWMTSSWAHFPRLERLVLGYLPNLKAIPLDIGEIPTLKSIRLVDCNNSLVLSVKEMVKVQEDMGNEDLQVSVLMFKNTHLVVENLASPNFKVETWPSV